MHTLTGPTNYLFAISPENFGIASYGMEIQQKSNLSQICPTSSKIVAAKKIVDRYESIHFQIDPNAQHHFDTFFSFMNRIKDLKEQAGLDGYSINRDSNKAFWDFFGQNPQLKRERLVLLENGNLRATWKNDHGTHIGLQFINNQLIQFVIFKKRDSTAPVSRLSGCDTMDGINQLITAYDLRDVLFA